MSSVLVTRPALHTTYCVFTRDDCDHCQYSLRLPTGDGQAEWARVAGQIPRCYTCVWSPISVLTWLNVKQLCCHVCCQHGKHMLLVTLKQHNSRLQATGIERAVWGSHDTNQMMNFSNKQKQATIFICRECTTALYRSRDCNCTMFSTRSRDCNCTMFSTRSANFQL